MGHSQSTENAELKVGKLTSSSSTVRESTNIEDLVKSGRYKVAKRETLDMMAAVQGEGGDARVRPGSEVGNLKQYIIEQEGLSVGDGKRKALSQQWRFFLSCEPMQRGLDAGIIIGSFAATAFAFRDPKNRIPAKVGLVFASGCCLGVITVPVLVVVADGYNGRRIARLEKELFAKQRADFSGKQG